MPVEQDRLSLQGVSVMRPIRLIVEESRRSDDSIIVSAQMEYSRSRRDELWFRVPCEHGLDVAESADPFIIACVALAMSRGRDLRVAGTASPSLLRNMELVQAYYASAWPAFYRKIGISADRVSEWDGKKPGALVAFSGGMDSCHTLFRHVRRLGEGPFYDIRGAVMIHGFDIPLGDGDGFAHALEESRRMTASLGVPLYDVTTNLRDLPVIWEHVYGPAVAAVLSLFAKHHGHGLMASSHQVRGNILGSHPELDVHCSSDAFEIIHDGAYIHKLEKAALLKNWPEAMKHLRVCWEGRDRSANCGQCEKCIRTILIFRANGIFPPCFERDIGEDEIRKMKIMQVNLNGTYLPMLEWLKKHGIAGSWVDTLQENVDRHQRRPCRKLKERIPPALVLRLYQAQAWGRPMKRRLASLIGRG